MSILDTIVAHKKKEIASCKELITLEQLRQMPHFQRSCFSLKEGLTDPVRTGIIAEFKRKSPSKGIINDQSDVVTVTTQYAAHGASALSILTDFNFFGGSVDDLQKARDVNNIPILRKEVIIDPYQVYEAKAIGADAILLIAAILSRTEAEELAHLAHELGLEVLMELHDETELDILNNFVDVAGVNNRNLKTFEVSLSHSASLAKQIPPAYLKISESGIASEEDISYLRNHGFKGFLIGENFMKASNPGRAFNEFINQLQGVKS